MKTLKKPVFISLLLCLCLGICACSNSADPKTVSIGLLSIDDSLPFFVAQEEGFFTERNVDVNLVQFGSAKDKETALEAGQLDGDMTDLIVAALLKKGDTDIRVVSFALGATPAEGRFVILASPNSDISSIEDLKGVPIAVGNNTIVHYVAEKVAMMNGFSDSEIQTLNIPDLSLRLETMLSGKDVLACVLPDPLASLAISLGAKSIVDDTTLDVNLSQSIVLFRKDSIDTKSEEIQKVMDAYFAAMVFINDPANADKVKEYQLQFTNIPPSLQTDYPVPTYTPNAIPDESMIDEVQAWMVSKGLLEEAYSYDQLIDSRFIK